MCEESHSASKETLVMTTNPLQGRGEKAATLQFHQPEGFFSAPYSKSELLSQIHAMIQLGISIILK